MTGHVEAGNQVAILILTYNHEKYIGPCLESILCNGLKSWHVWVLDDGSTDATRDIVQTFAATNQNITLLSQTHSGGNTSRCSQRLIEDSAGEYIVLMSGDDLFGPTHSIARSAAALDANSNLAAVIPRMVYLMQDPSLRAPECHGPELLSALRTGDPRKVLERHLYRSVSRIFLQGMMIRRSVIEAFGGFDTETVADDYAFTMRLFNYLRDYNLSFLFDETGIWLYRVHATNVHRNPVRQFALIAEVVRKYVPQYARQNFCWDAMNFADNAQLSLAQYHAVNILGPAEAGRALAPAIRTTAKAAARSGNVLLICKILLSKGVDIAHRAIAARYLPKAIVRKLITWRVRCRLGN